MRILYDNKIDSYTLVATSEAPNYPASNIVNIQLSRVWRSAAVDVAQTIDIDAGAGNTITATGVAIAAHNLTSGATVSVVASANSDYSAPSTNASVTYSSGIMTKFFTSDAKRYWRISFTDTTNPDGYIEVGRAFLGTYLQVVSTFGMEFPEEREDTSQRFISAGGQVFGDEGVISRIHSLTFPEWAAAMRLSIISMYETVKKTKPVFVLLDEGDTTNLPVMYCVFEGPPSFSHILGQRYRGALTLREVH